MNTKVDMKHLLAREMSRKEFLKLTAGASIALFGVGNIAKYLMQYSSQSSKVRSAAERNTSAFGSSRFGI